MNCFVFIDELRKIKKDIKFIIVTERSEYAYEAFQNEVMDYILKPLSPDKITKTLKSKGGIKANS